MKYSVVLDIGQLETEDLADLLLYTATKEISIKSITCIQDDWGIQLPKGFWKYSFIIGGVIYKPSNNWIVQVVEWIYDFDEIPQFLIRDSDRYVELDKSIVLDMAKKHDVNGGLYNYEIKE